MGMIAATYMVQRRVACKESEGKVADADRRRFLALSSGPPGLDDMKGAVGQDARSLSERERPL
jgi:hypothetical protein